MFPVTLKNCDRIAFLENNNLIFWRNIIHAHDGVHVHCVVKNIILNVFYNYTDGGFENVEQQ